MIHVPLQGRFTLLRQKKNEDGSMETVEKLEFDNLITDYGLDYGGRTDGTSSLVRSVQVGSGSTPPANSDTALAAFVAMTTGTFSSTDGSQTTTEPWYHYRRWTVQFAQGAAAGNLTEVGIGTTTTQGNLFSRALILDSNGQPTTITILPSEFLTIIYELRGYPPTGDKPGGTVIIDGVERTITVRPYRRQWVNWASNLPFPRYDTRYDTSLTPGMGVSTGAMGDENNGQPNFNSQGKQTWAPYVNGTFRREVTGVWPVNEGNGTLRTACVSTGVGHFQFGIEPPIVKNNTMTLTLTLGVSWGRYSP